MAPISMARGASCSRRKGEYRMLHSALSIFFSLLVFRHASWRFLAMVEWAQFGGGAFKTLCGPDGRTRASKDGFTACRKKPCPQATPSGVAPQSFRL